MKLKICANFIKWRLLYVTAFGKYRIKHEEIYLKFSKGYKDSVVPTDLGRKQFFEFESHGIKPTDPDPYYIKLDYGRKWMDWLRNELKFSIMKFYGHNVDYKPSIEFYGWHSLREDWKGELHILKLLMNWCNFYPKWLFEENFEFTDIDISRQI